jgi:hypothetical protein
MAAHSSVFAVIQSAVGKTVPPELLDLAGSVLDRLAFI